MRDRTPEQDATIALLIDADNASPEHLDDVLLDPEGRCHRYRPLMPPLVERVDYRGVGRG